MARQMEAACLMESHPGLLYSNNDREMTTIKEQTTAMGGIELRVQLELHDAISFGWALTCCAHDRVEAEDVLQTVYLKVLQGQARFEGHSSFKTWLFAVIRRTASDERRRRWLRFLGLAKYTHECACQDDATESVEPADHQVGLRKEFLIALEQLPRRQKEVLHLVFYQDLSLQEASAVMAVSIGSARTHYERGKQNLRKWLKTQKKAGVYER